MNLDIFDESYFRDLGWIVGNKIEGKEVQVREVFLVQEKILKEEQFNIYGFFFPKETSQTREAIYLQHLLEKNTLLDRNPLLVMEEAGMVKEIVTGASLPFVSHSLDAHFGYQSFRNNLYLNAFTSYKFDSTNFFVSGTGRKATPSEVEEYVSTFCQKENYLKLLENLLIGLESCQFRDKYFMPPYLPDRFLPYYKKVDRAGLQEQLQEKIYSKNDFLDEYGNFSSKKLVKKL